jgi:DNA-binding transcriptional MerR regulator
MSYSIDQFSKITGISKLVLRTWENRYDYLKADRSKTKIRSYSDQLLIKALKTKHLIDSGYKISFITKKKDNELDNLIGELKDSSNDKVSLDYYINKMIESGITYNAQLFNKTYKECLLKFNHIEFYTNIMLPTFFKIGLFWLTNRMNPAQEHFLSEMFKQKIYSEIDKTKQTNHKLKKWLLFLPPNEHHEIGLLFSRFLLIKNGFNVIYLGSNVPLDSIKQICQTQEIDNLLFFSISNFSKTNLNETINFLEKNCKKTKKYLVAKSIEKNKLEEKDQINLINNLQQFIQLISH